MRLKIPDREGERTWGIRVKYGCVRAFGWVHCSQEKQQEAIKEKEQVPVIGWSVSSLQLTCEENLATSICVESKEEKGTGERACEKLREEESESAYKPMIGYYYSRSMYWIHGRMHKNIRDLTIEKDAFLDTSME